MQIFVLLSVAALTFAAPRPEEEGLVAEAYVHEDIPAEAYVHEDIPAETYVHEDIAAEAYVHEDIAAEAYVHEDIAAEAYVHEDIAAEAYNHDEIAAEEYVHVEDPVAPVAAPAVYTGYPFVHAYAGYPHGAVAYAGLPALTAAAPVAEVKSDEAVPAAAPVPYAYGFHYPYSFGAYPYLAHTGCVNNLGAVVPCAV